MNRGEHRRPRLPRHRSRQMLRLALIGVGLIALVGYVAVGCTLADTHLN